MENEGNPALANQNRHMGWSSFPLHCVDGLSDRTACVSSMKLLLSIAKRGSWRVCVDLQARISAMCSIRGDQTIHAEMTPRNTKGTTR